MSERKWTESERERQGAAEAGETVLANMKADHALIEWAEANGLFVRIDRRSPWGNPFVMPEDGDRDEVCDAFASYLTNKPSLIRRLDELRGKVLGCWCYPERCHGSELIWALENPPDSDPRRLPFEV